jgi:hypothetical protein
MISKQLEEMQMLEAKWQSELHTLKNTQRQEYRDFVVTDYQAKVQEAKKAADPQPLALPVVTKFGGVKPENPALQEILEPRSPRSPSRAAEVHHDSLSASSSSSGSFFDDEAHAVMPFSTLLPPQGAFLESVNPEFVAKLKELTDMGFDERTSECALNMANWSVVSLPLFFNFYYSFLPH